MAITLELLANSIQELQTRLLSIEKRLNAITPLKQHNDSVTILTDDINDLKTRVTILESDVQELSLTLEEADI